MSAFLLPAVFSCYSELVLIDPRLLRAGAVSAGRHVSVHGSAAGPPRPVEPAGTQPVRSGHHGRCLGKTTLAAPHYRGQRAFLEFRGYSQACPNMQMRRVDAVFPLFRPLTV